MGNKNSDKIKFRGKVGKVLHGNKFHVKLENGFEIFATVSGKMKMHRIQILPGDTVEVELSPYDLTQGRIVYRTS